MTEKQSIILTRSMERVLREKRLPLETVLDFPQMYKLFSPNDLASLLTLQSLEEARPLHDNQGLALEGAWTNKFANGFSDTQRPVFAMGGTAPMIQSLRDQLTLPQGCELDKDATPIQIFDSSKDVFFIVIDTGFDQYLRFETNEIAVIRAIITVLLNYIPLNVLAKGHKLFKRWIRLTAVNNVLRPPQPVIE